MTASVTPSRYDAGNIDYEVEGQPRTFMIFERWQTREALEGHLQAPRMQELVPQLMDGTVEDGIRLQRRSSGYARRFCRRACLARPQFY
jgi:quinol monooxygenase YgiN